MKRFWLILLSLGLMAAFSTSAMAVDVKLSAEFFAAGIYQDKTSFKKDTGSDGPSTAFYFQRLRLRTDFVISTGLILTTRADIMERSWGAARSVPDASLDTLSAGTRAENENIVFDVAYLSYTSPIGLFTAGYQIDGVWGTAFGNSSQPRGEVTWTAQINSIYFGLQAVKASENSRTAKNLATANATDRDNNFYYAFVIYGFQNGSAGLLFAYQRLASARGIISEQTGYTSTLYGILPYIKMKLGPVDIQAEINYGWGTAVKWDGAFSFLKDTRAEDIIAFLDATADFGKFYIGGSFAYVAGDDPGTGKIDGGLLNGGADWNPCLIMFNSDRSYWAGLIPGYDGSFDSGPMTNAWFFQGRAGARPMDKLDLMASVSFANADKKPTSTWLYNDYGWEVDLTAVYKITNNLSYMLGGGYLFAGKYYKGTSDTNNIVDNYMLINKLTLTF